MSSSAHNPSSVHPDCLGPRFVVEEVLGRGGMGIVYRAFDRELGREVAVKLTLGDSTPKVRARLQREGQALAQLTHPGVVQVHAVGTLAQGDFLVVELVEGARSLQAAWVELDLEQRVRLVRDAARALGAAHARGIVHRDVKPDNLLVDAVGRVRVTDFGVALVSGAERLTQTGGIVGTPHYMAPEQFASERDAIGPHSDVWSLGVVLYQAMTDELPFVSDSIGQLGFEIARATPEAPQRLNPKIPRDLARVCLTAIGGDPGQRYPDGESMARALDACLEGGLDAGRAKGRTVGLAVGAAVVALLATLLALGLYRHRAAPPIRPEPTTTPAPPPTPPPAADDDEARERQGALNSWRRLQSPLERYVDGVALLARWPEAVDLAPVRGLVKQAKESRTPLAVLRAKGEETHVSFGPGHTLYSVASPTVIEWNARTGEEASRQVPTPGVAQSRVFALRNGDLVMGGRSFDWLRPEAEPLHLPEPRYLSGVCHDAQQRVFVAPGRDGTIEVYDVSSRALLGVLSGDYDPALSVAVSPDGTRVAAFVGKEQREEAITELIRGELIVWKLPARELLFRTSLLHRTRYATFSADGERVFAGSTSGSISSYDAATGEPAGELVSGEETSSMVRPRAHDGSVRSLAVLDDTRMLSVAGISPGNPYGHQARLWNLETGAMLWELRPLPNYPASLSVSPELGLYAVGTFDGDVELYALPDLR